MRVSRFGCLPKSELPMVKGQQAEAGLNGLMRATGKELNVLSMGDGDKTSLTNDAYVGTQ